MESAGRLVKCVRSRPVSLDARLEHNARDVWLADVEPWAFVYMKHPLQRVSLEKWEVVWSFLLAEWNDKTLWSKYTSVFLLLHKVNVIFMLAWFFVFCIVFFVCFLLFLISNECDARIIFFQRRRRVVNCAHCEVSKRDELGGTVCQLMPMLWWFLHDSSFCVCFFFKCYWSLHICKLAVWHCPELCSVLFVSGCFFCFTSRLYTVCFYFLVYGLWKFMSATLWDYKNAISLISVVGWVREDSPIWSMLVQPFIILETLSQNCFLLDPVKHLLTFRKGPGVTGSCSAMQNVGAKKACASDCGETYFSFQMCGVSPGLQSVHI